MRWRRLWFNNENPNWEGGIFPWLLRVALAAYAVFVILAIAGVWRAR